jgi:hypothetical protein
MSRPPRDAYCRATVGAFGVADLVTFRLWPTYFVIEFMTLTGQTVEAILDHPCSRQNRDLKKMSGDPDVADESHVTLQIAALGGLSLATRSSASTGRSVRR